MKVVIMAGGFGTRIRPLTADIPKPMLPLMNRPLLLHTIETLKRHGLRDVLILLHHRPEQIKSFFGNGRRFGVNIRYVTPPADLGTAGAVRAAKACLGEPFLLISGDLLTDIDLTALIARHNTTRALASIALTRVRNPHPFGVVSLDHLGRITRFVEKPHPDNIFSDTVNAGIYVIAPQLLELIPAGIHCDWSRDIFTRMLQQALPLYGLLCNGYWQDIGTPQSYLEACLDIFAGNVECADIAIGKMRAAQSSGCLLHKKPRGMLLLGEKSRIAPTAELHNVVIGRNCVIEPGCVLENAVLWDNVHLGRNTRIRSAVLASGGKTAPDSNLATGTIIASGMQVATQPPLTGLSNFDLAHGKLFQTDRHVNSANRA